MAANAAVASTLTIQPATNVIGAHVDGIDLRRPLDAGSVRTLRDALLQWKVLFFRNQPISQDDHVRLGQYFGEITPAHPIQAALEGRPEIYAVDTREERILFGHGTQRPPFAPPSA